MKKCLGCKKTISPCHFNKKRCTPCAKKLAKIPYPNQVTPELVRKIRELSKTEYKKDICKELGLSWSFVGRVKHHFKITERFRDYPKDTVERVCRYYAEHGVKKTIEQFPGIKIRSIFERYYKDFNLSRRQIRWTPKQIRQCVIMGGLVPIKMQARFFDRPNAHEGSIKSFWHKRLKEGSAQAVNGFPLWKAKFLIPYKAWAQAQNDISLKVKGLSGSDKQWKKHEYSRRIILWVDLEKHMKPTVPLHIQKAIRVMAKFQRWIHGTSRVRSRVQKMIQSSTPEALSKLLKG